ncbi:hypothetical protein V8F20_010090 [Naviculisporaceae sp. PSN 640]
MSEQSGEPAGGEEASRSETTKRAIIDGDKDGQSPKPKQPRIHRNAASKSASSTSTPVASHPLSAAAVHSHQDHTTPRNPNGSSLENPMADYDQFRAPENPDLLVQRDEAFARELQAQLNKEVDVSVPRSKGPEYQVPENTQLDISPTALLQAYGRELLSVQCGKCRAPYNLGGHKIINRCKLQVTLHRPEMHPFVTCPKCQLLFCIGCGKYGRLLADLTDPRTKDHPNPGSHHCCDKGRIFLLFSLLCGPDDVLPPSPEAEQPFPPKPTLTTSIRDRLRPRQQPSTPEKDTKQTTAKSSSSSLFTIPSLSVPPVAFSKGTGYGGSRSQGPVFTAKKNLDASETHLARYFTQLSALLPNFQRTNRTGFDLMDQPLILAMLMRSPLLPALLDYLHNNCMEEISKKLDLYEAAISLLATLNGHPSMSASLFRPLRLWPRQQQLVFVTFSKTTQSFGPVETTRSIASALAKLAGYCRYYCEKFASHISESQDTDGGRVLELSQQICSLADSQEEGLKETELLEQLGAAPAQPPQRVSSVKTRAGRLKEDREKLAGEMKVWNAANRVLDIPDHQFCESYYFTKQAQALNPSSVSKGRMKTLVSQLASLRNDLPDGIFVRHASSRLDALKVLFVGPAGTPYENGLFEFDFFCPANFPNSPPKAQFRTTGGGRARFNPNLYADGKVCLSLLNTWSGPKWIPNESTLLQLMVSIQAMIFVERPFYNEPGYEGSINHRESDKYNRGIQEHTVRSAMIYWLTDRLGGVEKKSDKGKAPVTPVKKQPAVAPKPSPSSAAKPLDNSPLSKLAAIFVSPPPDDEDTLDLPTIEALLANAVTPEEKETLSAQKLALQQKQAAHLAQMQKLQELMKKSAPKLCEELLEGLGWDKDEYTFQEPDTKPQEQHEELMKKYDAPEAYNWKELVEELGWDKYRWREPDTKPIGNTIADSNDDNVWGPVIRKHFSLHGREILEKTQAWEKTWEARSLKLELGKCLEKWLKAHKFI